MCTREREGEIRKERGQERERRREREGEIRKERGARNRKMERERDREGGRQEGGGRRGTERAYVPVCVKDSLTFSRKMWIV